MFKYVIPQLTTEGIRIKLFSTERQAIARIIDVWKMGTIC